MPDLHTLALSVINDGKTYKERCDKAQHANDAQKARYYIELCRIEARQPHYGGQRFTVRDIAVAAADVNEYMERHVKELV